MGKKRLSRKYIFKVYPQGRSREIYRVIEISGSKSLDDLCVAIINAYDFIHEHLYEFCMDNKPYSDNCYQSLTDDDRTETNIKIDKLKLQKGQNFLLLYDYGDDWMFTIHVQKVEEGKEAVETKVIGEKGKLVQYPDWDDEDDEFEEAFSKFNFDNPDVVLTPFKEELYDLALRFKKAALWKHLWDNQVFAVKLRNDEIGYVCIMGKGGTFCGMNLYVGQNSYNSYRRLQNSTIPNARYFQEHEQLLSQNCIQLTFSSKEELHPVELAELKVYSNVTGVRLSGSDPYPQFVKFSKNCYPWMVKEELDFEYLWDGVYAATLLAEELNQHAKKSNKKKTNVYGQMEFCFDSNNFRQVAQYKFEIPEVTETTLEVPCFEVKNDEIVATGMVKLPEESPKQYQKPVLQNHVLAAGLKKLPHVGIWEAELVRLTKPVHEKVYDPYDIPIFPAMIMMVSKKNGYLLPAMVSMAKEDDFTELLLNLAEAWQEETQVPSKILARDERTKSFLDDICGQLGISVSISLDGLPSLDEAQERFLQELEGDLMPDGEDGKNSDERVMEDFERMIDIVLEMDIKELRKMPKGMISDLKSFAAFGLLPSDKEEALLKKLAKL